MAEHANSTALSVESALLPHEAERNPIVFVKNGEVLASSRDVAEFFEKRHDHVLRDIDNLIKSEGSPKLGNLFVERNDYHEQARKNVRSFDMTCDGFTLLGMGFTGTKALTFKLRYIAQFNAMEAELRQPASIDYLDPKNILGFVGALQAQVAEKDAVIVEQGTRLKKLDRLEGARGTMCVTDAAKTLGVGRDYLFQFMSSRKWIFKRAGNKNWLAYDVIRKAAYLEHDDHLYMDDLGRERVSTRVLVTAKGLVKLAELLEQPLH